MFLGTITDSRSRNMNYVLLGKNDERFGRVCLQTRGRARSIGWPGRAATTQGSSRLAWVRMLREIYQCPDGRGQASHWRQDAASRRRYDGYLYQALQQVQRQTGRRTRGGIVSCSRLRQRTGLSRIPENLQRCHRTPSVDSSGVYFQWGSVVFDLRYMWLALFTRSRDGENGVLSDGVRWDPDAVFYRGGSAGQAIPAWRGSGWGSVWRG